MLEMPVVSYDPDTPPDIGAFVVKIASRCNLACTYCYWFEDSSVMSLPKFMNADVRDALISKIGSHLDAINIPAINVYLHGGEPLLYGKERTATLLEMLRELEERWRRVVGQPLK